MSSLRIVKELDRKKWSEFIYNHPNGNIFQTPQMYEIYKNTKNWEPLFLAALDASDNVVGVLLAVIKKEFSGIFGKFSARAIIWGGPLVEESRNKNEIVDFLLKRADGILKGKVIYTEFRNLWEFSQEKSCFFENNYSYECHLDYHIDLTLSQDNLFNNMSEGRRKNIKKCLRSKLSIVEINKLEGIEVFYDILRNTYRRIHLSCPSLAFFKNAFSVLGVKEMISFFLVLEDGKSIASRAVLIYKNKMYDWYAGSTKKAYDSHANDLLIWNILIWGKNKGYQLFDFGGAGSPYAYYGPAEFKRRFGGKEVNYGRFQKVYIKKIYWLIKKYTAFFQKSTYGNKTAA